MMECTSKVYKGHSKNIYLHIERIEDFSNMGKPPTQRVIFEMIRDFRNDLSPAILKEIALWSLEQIKKQQEETPANVSWYNNALNEINKLIENDKLRLHHHQES